jgi:hypothetical protein
MLSTYCIQRAFDLRAELGRARRGIRHADFARGFAAILILIQIRNPSNIIHLRNFWKVKFENTHGRQHPFCRHSQRFENGKFNFGKIIVQRSWLRSAPRRLPQTPCSQQRFPACYRARHGMGLAMVTVIGQCVGAGDYAQARAYVKKNDALYLCLHVSDQRSHPAGRKMDCSLFPLSPDAIKTCLTVMPIMATLHLPFGRLRLRFPKRCEPRRRTVLP